MLERLGPTPRPYSNQGIRHLWLWAPEVPNPVLDLPLLSLVLDLQQVEVDQRRITKRIAEIFDRD